jgi:hypothetical protein
MPGIVSECSHCCARGTPDGLSALSRCYTFNSVSIATYYDILRVGPQAAPEGVRAAYRALAQKYHPDKLPGNTDAVRVMAMLNEAYAVLSDPEQRARYDRSIACARAQADNARRAAIRVEVHDASWPWWLLFATIAFAATAIGTVAYRMMFPAVTVPTVQVQAQASVNSKLHAAAPAKLTKN